MEEENKSLYKLALTIGEILVRDGCISQYKRMDFMLKPMDNAAFSQYIAKKNAFKTMSLIESHTKRAIISELKPFTEGEGGRRYAKERINKLKSTIDKDTKE